MRHVFTGVAVLLFTAVTLTGCSNDDGNGTGPVGTDSTSRDASGDYWVTKTDATPEEDFVYYSFDDKDVVTSAKPAANTWELGFRRSVIITNSGESGSGDVTSVDLTAMGVTDDFVDVTMTPANAVPEESWLTDGLNLVLDDYFMYNPQTHTLTMTQTVYAMRDAAGQYMKVQFLELIGGGAPPAMGNFVIKYVHQPSPSSTDLTGPALIDTVDGSSGMFYYDFSSGQAVNPANPASSTEWDIKVENYDVYLNSSFSGPGEAAANPAYALLEDMSDPTDFDAYTQAITVPQAYAQDEQGSVFTDWYNYNSQTHTLSSKNHVYLIRSNGKTYKVMIDTYYGETGQSGNYIWYWEEL